MSKQEEFFSKSHKHLLNVATWAKYLAWVVLVVYIFMPFGQYVQEQNYYAYSRISGAPSEFIDLLIDRPLFGISIFMEIAGIFLKGVVSFLVLKGISLGVTMIVETDINYREKRGGVP